MVGKYSGFDLSDSAFQTINHTVFQCGCGLPDFADCPNQKSVPSGNFIFH
jgi:hypothetical protein